MGDADQHHFGGWQRPAGLLHLGDALEQHLPGAGEHADRKGFGKSAAADALGLCEGAVLAGFRHDLEAGHEMGEFRQFAQHGARVGTGIILRLQFGQRCRQVSLEQQLEKIDDAGPVGEAEHGPHVIEPDPPGGMGNSLVEQGHGIAGRALGRAGNGLKCFLVSLDLLGGADTRQMADEHARLDAAQVETLAARQDCDRYLADLGGGEDELCVGRRLFQRFQEGVEGRA